MKRLVFFLILFFAAELFALQADVTDDNSVDANDLVIFLGYWLDEPNDDPNCDFNEDGIVNFVDYAVLADEWSGRLSYNPITYPTAYDINTQVTTYVLTGIELNATDNDSSQLTYKISTLPSNGQLYDISFSLNTRGPILPGNLSNIASGFYKVSSTPYTLKRFSKTVYYYSTDTNSTSFTYKAYDGVSDSNAATVTVTKTAYPRDAISFDTNGLAVVDDNDAVEFDDSFSYTMWLKPQCSFCNILKKRDTGAGVQLSIRANHLRFEVWDSNSNYGDIRSIQALSLESWSNIGITGNATGTALYINGSAVGDYNSLPAVPYSNDANLVIGEGFVGDIDRFSFWPWHSDFDMSLIGMEARTGSGGGPLIPDDYICRWNCDEASGSTITDTELSLVGNLTNVAWLTDEQPYKKNKPQFNKLGK